MKNTTRLAVGQFSLFIGFVLFMANYFFLGNFLSLALVSGALFVISLVFNLTYIVKRKKCE